MGKYTELEGSIYAIFATPEWQAETIKTFPSNYIGSGVEFIRVSIIASSYSMVNPPKSASGQLIIDIFVPAGMGTKRSSYIADRLDVYLAGKTISTNVGTTQLGISSLGALIPDGIDASLARVSYSISFNFFGN